MCEFSNVRTRLHRVAACLLILLLLFSVFPISSPAVAAEETSSYLSDFEALKQLCEEWQNSTGYHTALCEKTGFRIEEDLVIPAWLHLQFVDLIVPEGVTLSVSKNTTLYATKLQLDGTILNSGDISQGIWHKSSETNEVSVGENGRIENSGKLSLANPVPAGTVEGSGKFTVDREYRLQTSDFDGLKAACESALADPGADYELTVGAESELQIDEDLETPENLILLCFGKNILVPKGVTLSVRGKLHLRRATVRVQGRLVNEGDIFFYGTAARIHLDDGAEYSGSGDLICYETPEDYFPAVGIERSRFRKTMLNNPISFQLKNGENSPDKPVSVYSSTFDALQRAVRAAEEDPETRYKFEPNSSETFTIESDLTVPENLIISVWIDMRLIIPAKTTVTLLGEIQMHSRSRMTVSGSLANNGRITSNGKDACIVKERTGKYSGTGLIDREIQLEGFSAREARKAQTTPTPAPKASPTSKPATAAPSSTPKTAATSKPVPSPTPEITSRNEPGSQEYLNPDTGYRALILDELGLLTDSERSQLLEDMKPITEFGHVAFWSTKDYARSEVEQARLKRRELFGMESGAILAINMNIRKVSIQSYGTINHTISKAQANTITNNVRNYLTRGEYYQGAKKAYGQIYTLLVKGRIPQPMKYFSNAVIALTAAMILMLFFVLRHASSFEKPDAIKVIETGAIPAALLYHASSRLTRTRREYVPVSSSSGSSGGSSCSSCSSGSSCSSCGSGGSSSF